MNLQHTCSVWDMSIMISNSVLGMCIYIIPHTSYLVCTCSPAMCLHFESPEGPICLSPDLHLWLKISHPNIFKHDWHVRTYLYYNCRENRALIHSLVLMHSAVIMARRCLPLIHTYQLATVCVIICKNNQLPAVSMATWYGLIVQL